MIVVVGLSHHTAPIAVRERLAIPADGVEHLLRGLYASDAVAEVFVVSTCNRVEIVAVPISEDEASTQRCVEMCVAALFRGHPVADKYIYQKRDLDAVRHLVRVAASLDSLVVGEPQILGQLKQGFERARRARTVGPTLHRVMSRAVRGAKRVRSETLIGVGQVSVPSIAVELAEQIFGDMKGRTAVLVGSGEMGQSVARLLRDCGSELIVMGRSMDRVAPVAERVGGRAALLSQLNEALPQADVVVSSTSASQPVISKAAVKAAIKRRRGHLFLIDLAVPRDIEAGVEGLDGVFLYNVDDLSQVAAESAETRMKEADRAAEMVEAVVRDWRRWADAQQATPTIKALRAKFKAAFDREMEKSLRGRLRELDSEQRDAVEKLMAAGIKRMLHAPSVRLREEASREDGWEIDELCRAMSELFELDECDELRDSGPWREFSRSTSSRPGSGRSAESPSPSPQSVPSGTTESAARQVDSAPNVGTDAEGHGELSRGWG